MFIWAIFTEGVIEIEKVFFDVLGEIDLLPLEWFQKYMKETTKLGEDTSSPSQQQPILCVHQLCLYLPLRFPSCWQVFFESRPLSLVHLTSHQSRIPTASFFSSFEFLMYTPFFSTFTLQACKKKILFTTLTFFNYLFPSLPKLNI